jgi:hypothetical protein
MRLACYAAGYASVVDCGGGITTSRSNGPLPVDCVSVQVLFIPRRQSLSRTLLIDAQRYISDVGAHNLQPLFIAMGTVTVVTFDFVFIAERWLRHRGTLAANTSWFQKTLSILATIFAIAGAIGLILLTCLNDVSHHRAHDICLCIFM